MKDEYYFCVTNETSDPVEIKRGSAVAFMEFLVKEGLELPTRESMARGRRLHLFSYEDVVAEFYYREGRYNCIHRRR